MASFSKCARVVFIIGFLSLIHTTFACFMCVFLQRNMKFLGAHVKTNIHCLREIYLSYFDIISIFMVSVEVLRALYDFWVVGATKTTLRNKAAKTCRVLYGEVVLL